MPLAVQIMLSSTDRVVFSQLGEKSSDGSSGVPLSSMTDTFSSGTLPMFLTSYFHSIDWLARMVGPVGMSAS
jgi:hypothetical protein